MNSQRPSAEVSPPTISHTGSDFGARIRAARTARGHSQSELAELAGIAPSYLCGIERALRPAPAAQIVERLVTALSLPAEEAEMLALEADQSRAAWRGRARARKAPAPASADAQVSGCLTQAIDAMRRGWCTRVEVIAQGDGHPVRLVLWRAPDDSMEAAM